jgi:hypothetical protein
MCNTQMHAEMQGTINLSIQRLTKAQKRSSIPNIKSTCMCR